MQNESLQPKETEILGIMHEVIEHFISTMELLEQLDDTTHGSERNKLVNEVTCCMKSLVKLNIILEMTSPGKFADVITCTECIRREYVKFMMS